MAEVAKMLGVELGEEFEIDYATDVTTLSAKITDTGFHIINSNNLEFSGLFLNLLLSGQLEIKRKPWNQNVEKRIGMLKKMDTFGKWNGILVGICQTM